MKRLIIIIIGWLAVVLATLGVILPLFADNAFPSAASMVFCPLVGALSPLAAVLCVVCQLFVLLAAEPCNAPRGEAKGDSIYSRHLRDFSVAGEDSVD